MMATVAKVAASNQKLLSGMAATDWSWGALIFDFENDGDDDIMTTTWGPNYDGHGLILKNENGLLKPVQVKIALEHSVVYSNFDIKMRQDDFEETLQRLLSDSESDFLSQYHWMVLSMSQNQKGKQVGHEMIWNLIDYDDSELIEEMSPLDQDFKTSSLSHSDFIRGVLASLDDRESYIVRMRFGIGLSKEYTLEEISQTIGLSRERIRQLSHNAIDKLSRSFSLGV